MRNRDRSRYDVLVIVKALCVVLLALCAKGIVGGELQSEKLQKRGISSGHPLAVLADMLEERYGKVVSYEDPMIVWRGDLMVRRNDENAKWGVIPKTRELVLPYDITNANRPALELGTLSGIVSLYGESNGDGPRFRVSSSWLGLHMIPDVVRNSDGIMKPAVNPLDLAINVSIEKRLPSEHFEAICAALSEEIGIEIKPNAQFLNQHYVPNGRYVPKDYDRSERGKYCIAWGTEGNQKARDAILSLIKGSGTTLTWRLMFVSSAAPEDRFWVFNLLPLKIIVVDRDGREQRTILEYDRCNQCGSIGAVKK